MKILAIIPARGGSKEIPRKNLFPVNGKPLLYYTVSACLNSTLVNRTIVSTDDSEIANVAKNLNAEVVKRPKKLSGDSTSVEPVLKHVLNFLKDKENYVPDVIILPQNTSPLRTSQHIDEALSLLIKKNFDSVLSGYPYHIFVWNKINQSTIKPHSYDPQNRLNRQDTFEQILENGAIYATKTSAFKKSNCRISGKIGFYEMPTELSHNIDTLDDLKKAEKILQEQNQPQNLFSVKGKNIILTGASGLLGSYFARILLERGANMALIDHNPSVSESLKNEFSSTGQNICVYRCDLSKPKEINSTFKKIVKDFSTLDVLINNAAFVSAKSFGIKDFKNFETHPFELWKKSFEVNVDAPFLLCQNVLGIMKKQKSGSIINISSNYGLLGPDFDTYKDEKLWTPPGYAVTKSAILNLTRYIANLYGKDGIRCNTLSPSGVATDKLTNRFKKRYASRNAFKRMAKVSDYAGPMIFLCSDASGYMTGANLIIDGGWTAK
ncbi:N-acylneuraminate cytidylyltransferase protein [Marine Group I thaumarchaeote SCGC AAA799-P11]|uniref:N-acylneuraminate cytidylyltransferase protein n=1 Tax=Marine Group I thaumarchaeote SCGC AAA799-P11 TaxID=1502295 RepID=A0A087S2Y8_9ARCH|nr:N-acylneuraminate cytidylyltransferase protein [Marine Group I thaumarchaeote SCGC AAA799-P11]